MYRGIFWIAFFQLTPKYFGIVKLTRSHELQSLLCEIILSVQRDGCPKQGQQNPSPTANP
jgi:hypothetical protein